MLVRTSAILLATLMAGCSAASLRGSHRGLQPQTRERKALQGQNIKFICSNTGPNYSATYTNKCTWNANDWMMVNAVDTNGLLTGCKNAGGCVVNCDIPCMATSVAGSSGGAVQGSSVTVVSPVAGNKPVPQSGGGVGYGAVVTPPKVNVQPGTPPPPQGGAGGASVNPPVGSPGNNPTANRPPLPRAGSGGGGSKNSNKGGGYVGGASQNGGLTWSGNPAPLPWQRGDGSGSKKGP